MAVVEFLGFKYQDVGLEIPSPLDPITLKEVGGETINNGSSEDDAKTEYNEKLLAALFRDCTLEVPALDYDDTSNLQRKFVEILAKLGRK